MASEEETSAELNTALNALGPNPTRELLRATCTEVLTRHDPTLVSVKLVGRSSIIAGAFPGNEWLNGMSEKFKAVNSERHIEVDITGGQMDVITRRGDEFTHALADGFVEFVVRYWGGVAEEM